ncbi:MAG: hypothetical protein IPL86_16280 [Flavobacteriales bacterium]|nr:hypothetical protein [Flavobacteriales bacterium]
MSEEVGDSHLGTKRIQLVYQRALGQTRKYVLFAPGILLEFGERGPIVEPVDMRYAGLQELKDNLLLVDRRGEGHFTCGARELVHEVE